MEHNHIPDPNRVTKNLIILFKDQLVIGGNHKGALLTINDRATGMLKMKQIERQRSQSDRETNTVELLEE